MKRQRWVLIGLVIAAGVSFAIVSGGQAGPPKWSSPAETVSIDCGSSKAGAKKALRSFAGVLRRGDEQEILSLLAGRKRFFALGAGSANGSFVGSTNPRDAAKQIADYGGLPIRIDEFMNADRPSRVTDFGFFGTWNGRRPARGKAAIDCKAGTVIVFNVGVGSRDFH